MPEHTIDGFDLSPLTEEELSRRYDTVMILGNRTIMNEQGICLPANPPNYDEHGIVGGDYRVEAAVAMHAVLGMVCPMGKFGFIGNAHRPLNMTQDVWERTIVQAQRDHGERYNMENRYQRSHMLRPYAEAAALKASFAVHARRMLPAEARAEDNPIDRTYTDDAALDSLDALVTLARTRMDNATSCDEHRQNKNKRTAFVTNWFHTRRVDMLKHVWPNIWSSHPLAIDACGQPLDPDVVSRAADRWDVISAERLLVTALGEERRSEIVASYLGAAALPHTQRRVEMEAAGLEALKGKRYALKAA